LKEKNDDDAFKDIDDSNRMSWIGTKDSK